MGSDGSRNLCWVDLAEPRDHGVAIRWQVLLANLRKPLGIVFTYEAVSIEAINGQLVHKVTQRPIHQIKTAWAGALRRARLPHYRFHDLRHTFNSRLAEIGIIADCPQGTHGPQRRW
jgi:integrase